MLEGIVMMKSSEGFWLQFNKSTSESTALVEIRQLINGYFTRQVLSGYYSPLFEVAIEKGESQNPKTQLYIVVDRYYDRIGIKGVPRQHNRLKKRKLIFMNIQSREKNNYHIPYRFTFGARTPKNPQGEFVPDYELRKKVAQDFHDYINRAIKK